jgi:heme exporter protein B
MNNFVHLLKYEVTICHRSYHLFRHSFYITMLASIILSIMLSSEHDNTYTKMILIVFGSVMAAVTIPSHLIKSDMQDGSLENMLAILPPSKIIIAKYFGLITAINTGILCTLPLIMLFYGLEIEHMAFLFLVIMPILLQVIAIIILGNLIHAYFKQNTNLILAIIIPLIIPSLIMASMGIKTLNSDFIFIIIGIDMIFIPIILMLSSYLCANLYEF